MTRVRLFTTATCAYCKNIKTYLVNKQIEHEIIDCTIEPQQIRPASDISGVFTVPQTKIGRTVIVGLDYGKLADTLRKEGLIE